MPAHERENMPGPVARQRFGHTLRLWRIRAGWNQDTLFKWGQAAGFPACTDAVINKLENGKTAQPLPMTFLQLGIANERLEREEYGTIPDRRLRDLVKAQRPILKKNDAPWTATDFFAHFCGLEPPPPWAEGPAAFTLSPEAAEKLSQQQRETFLRYAQESMLSRIEAWAQLEQHCAAMRPDQKAVFKLVLAGHRAWEPAELAAMTDDQGRNLAITALETWCDQDGLMGDFRNHRPDEP